MAGDLAHHAPDLGTALRSAILCVHLHDRGGVPGLWVDAGQAMLGYAIYQPEVPGTKEIYDGAIAIGYNILRDLSGPDWKATELCFYRSRPDNLEPYRRFFPAPLRFGADFNAVVFAASWLDRPLRGANLLIHRRIMQEIESFEAKGAGDLATQLRRVLRRMLVGSIGHGGTRLKQIAELFAIHQRTRTGARASRGRASRPCSTRRATTSPVSACAIPAYR